MDEEVLFSEEQRFKQWWLWLILLGINGLFLVGCYQQLVLGQTFGDKPMADEGLIATTLGTFALSFFFIFMKLQTRVQKEGVYVRFFPLQIKFRHYSWESILRSRLRTYSAIAEYGGWGLRFGIFGSGRALNVSGDKGWQLELSDGKKLLIGTQKQEELRELLLKMGKLTD